MEQKIRDLESMAKRMRLRALDMAYAAGKNGAHLGGGLSAMEIFAVLYGAVLHVDREKPFEKDRDIVLLGKAHGVLAYYTALYERGFLSDADLASFEKNGSDLIGHPVKKIEKGIEYAGGSLGMALSVGAGLALSAKRRHSLRKIYVILGDGECQEGSVWEAVMFAARYRLENLIIIVDQNGIQSDGKTQDVIGFEDLSEKFRAFGCHVIDADGHSVGDLLRAFREPDTDAPKAVIARTVKGKGVSFMENDHKWHHAQLTREQYEEAVRQVSCS